MSETMTNQDWQQVHDIAFELRDVDANVVQKLQAYLRIERNAEKCGKLLQTLNARADSFLRLSHSQQQQRGISFIRTESMAHDYKHLSQALQPLLGTDPCVDKVTVKLGWIARLVRYYTDAGRAELAERSSAPAQPTPPPRREERTPPRPP